MSKILGSGEKAREALLYKHIGKAGNLVHCNLCSHYCIIKEGGAGKCLVRKNIGGKLYSLNWGKSAGFAIDPMEKKPFFHFKPGSRVLSFGTPGCNFRCLNCQNWDLSQAVKEGGKGALDIPTTTPAQIARMAKENMVDGVAYTYSEPTIFYEYAKDTVEACRKEKLDMFHVFVSNGYFTKEMLEDVVKEKLLQGIRIDLKFINDEKYMEVCSGHMQIVKDNIKRVHALRGKISLEIIALVIPTLNDSEEDIRNLCKFVASVGKDIPLHFSRFYPQYKMQDLPPTEERTLLRAREIAKEEGLEYVYVGNTNLPDVENTYCPKCNELLVKRNGFSIEKNVFEKLSGKEKKNPKCPKCGHKINIVL
ncbi:Radical SAM superfamily protein [Candidatus Anstonella stagnisolia]|nr:Radical SAM superfamily protein [Candidatus Anstonella stagnisolia]